MSRKYFGTDGIRGKVGVEPISPQFFLKFGWALGKILKQEHSDERRCKVLIGKDTRISGYMFESALEAGLISAGVDVLLLGPMPTPAVAYLTRTFQADAGIVISASHNPYTDNGIKLFNCRGTKLDDALELRIEAQLEQEMTTSDELGKAKRVDDAVGRYIEFCKGTAPWGFNLAGLDIVLDCSNGATYHIAPKVFTELGACVTTIGAQPDGVNINRGCGATSLELLSKTVIETKADLGIAFDGDGDRVMFVDHAGEIVDGDQLLFIIAEHRAKTTGSCEGVVGTLMTNLGCELALKKLGISFARAKVGDRYVIEAMNKNAWPLGGESSGHIVCSDVTTTGDGIISAIQVLKALVLENKSLVEAKGQISLLPQILVNVPVAKKLSPAELESNPKIQDALHSAEAELGEEGRILLRPSGTEPLIRVMAEGTNEDLVTQVVGNLAKAVEVSLAA